MRITVIGVSALVAVIVACSPSGQRKCLIPADDLVVLEQAETMELFSLHPKDGRTPFDEKAVQGGFRGWPVLGQTQIDDPETRKRVATDVVEGCLRSDGVMMKCFEPRHGIRVTRGDRTVDFVICYVCRFGYSYSGKEQTGYFPTDEFSMDRLNRLLQNASIPHAK